VCQKKHNLKIWFQKNPVGNPVTAAQQRLSERVALCRNNRHYLQSLTPYSTWSTC